MHGDPGGRWGTPGPLVPLAGGDRGDGAAIVAGDAGAGHVVALADTAPLQNRNLAVADNAALGLALATPTRAPDAGGGGQEERGTVVFIESVHVATASGTDALPPAWKWTALGLAVAGAAGLWAAAARFGPPEPSARALRPARVEHVAAVAADLDRVTAHPAEAAAPLAAASRAALAERLGLGPDPSPTVLRAAATAAGVPATVVALLDDPARDVETALAVGTLAADRQRAALGADAPEPTDRSSRGDRP